MLFGELEISKSYGHTTLALPKYISPTVICYVSGNCINFLDTGDSEASDHDQDHLSEDGHETHQQTEPSELRPITSDTQITAFTTFPKDNIVAYAERGTTTITIVKWSATSLSGSSGPPVVVNAPYDLSIVCLAFSLNGQYLAALGDLPNYTVSIWDWKSNSMLCSARNEAPASQISFNPANYRQLATSGLGGGIKFWDLKLGYKSYSLISRNGEDYPTTIDGQTQATTSAFELDPDDSTHSPISPSRHIWRPDQQVLAATEDGNRIVAFIPTVGSCKVFVSAKISRGSLQLGETREPDQDSENVNERFFADWGGPANIKAMVISREHIIVGGQDSVLRWATLDQPPTVVRSLKVGASPIIGLEFSPNYHYLMVTTVDGRIYTYSVHDSIIKMKLSNDILGVTCVDIARLSGMFVTGHSGGGGVGFWDLDRKCLLNRVEVTDNIISIAASPFSSMVAAGSNSGMLRLYVTKSGIEQPPSLIFRERLDGQPLIKLLFDPTGKYLAAVSSSGSIFFVDVYSKFKLLGRVELLLSNIVVRSSCWNFEEPEQESGLIPFLFLYILTSNEIDQISFVHRYTLPVDQELVPTEKGEPFSKSEVPRVTYRIDDYLMDIAVVPSQLTGGREGFYVVSADRSLKLYQAPGGIWTLNTEDQLQESVAIITPMLELRDHETSQNWIRSSFSGEWLFTWSTDGTIVTRMIMEPDKSIRIYVHDPFQGGVRDVAVSRDCRLIVSVGADGLLRILDWKISATGRRAAAEMSSGADRLIEEQSALINEIYNNIMAVDTVISESDGAGDSSTLTQEQESKLTEESAQSRQVDHRSNPIYPRFEAVREKITKMIAANGDVPEMERLLPEDFVIDFEERDRLTKVSDEQIDKVKQEIEQENLKKQIIANRIKRECWESMEVVGQSVISFRPDQLTGRLIEVSNYPIRKFDLQEHEQTMKAILLRRIQLLVQKSNKQASRSATARDSPTKEIPSKEVEVAEVDEDQEESAAAATAALAAKAVPAATEIDVSTCACQHILYDPFELNTNERKRTQVYLLLQVIHDIKRTFNATFKEFVRMKSDEISKIEEKNDRITQILAELQIQEAIFHPILTDDEVPERIIQVLDSEVTSERFITTEERKRIEEKKKMDEERLRAQQEDDSRERAIMYMMGGKLDDRSDQEEKEVLVRPEWMNKPKEDLSEEEKKLIKEFEKKMAVFKEEQEKYKKALETELRKLQSGITEICDGFDSNLRDLFLKKLDTDQQIFQNELKITKLTQSTLYSEDDEMKETELMKRLEDLKNEKTTCMTEIPEIKRDLEHCREEYEQAVKRDKEIEKAFKKEFHAYDFYFDALLKLFKKRQATQEEGSAPANDFSESPYFQYEKAVIASDEPVVALNPEIDMPEGLNAELWQKLQEIRDRKIASETEVRQCLKKFTDMQQLVQAVLEESERIRTETEKITSDYNAFLEYKFHTTYDLESLFELKQGQVEVAQAPVVTDYSDAILIHRSVVEQINEGIVALGKTKVDALREIKDYRKGIHALEWENKMLDFQAEDLVIRTRDIQLLRVTKQMQEYLRSGDEYKQSAEIAALEKRAEYSQKTHGHKIEEKKRVVTKIEKKIREKAVENKKLDKQLGDLASAVAERSKIHNVQTANPVPNTECVDKASLKEIYTRRKLVDLAKSQAQDIAILREEVERLRLRTYPAFPTTKPGRIV